MKKTFLMLLIILMLTSSISIGAPSPWALDEISKAEKLGLVTKSFEGRYQDDISREEFAELAVRFYERFTGKAIKPQVNPFTDTKNMDIIKANSLGIVAGTGQGKFSPGNSITREQLATMLYRAINIIDPSLISPKIRAIDFADNDKISDWAMEALVFMTNEGIIQGVSGNRLNPKGTTSIEQALALVKRTYEKYYSEGEKQELKASEISKLLSPAVVYLEVFDEYDNLISTGSGFIINDSGRIVTNYHVIEFASKIVVKLSSGRTSEIDYIVDFDQERDIGILQAIGSNYPYVKLGDSSRLENGDNIFTIGSPLGLENTITNGLVSNNNRILDGLKFLHISAPIAHGSSGGALINSYGEVVGVTTAMFTEGANQNLAIPINEVAEYLRSSNRFEFEDMYAYYYDFGFAYDSLEYEDGSFYYGEVEAGLPHGYGTMEFSNGDEYTGQWYRGQREGYGSYLWADGAYYSGDFEADLRNGYGHFWYSNNDYLEGYWLDGQIISPKGAPTISAKAISDNEVMVYWTEVPGADYYHIYYSYGLYDEDWYYFNDAGGNKRKIDWDDGLGFRIFNIESNTSIYVKLTAVKNGIESDFSHIAATSTFE